MYDPAEVKKVCKECEAQTKIVYGYNDSFFKPKLKGINHLQVGRSSMISSPLTILLEYLFLVFKTIRDKIQDFLKVLFPRHKKIYGKKQDTFIVGRITFARDDDLHTPVHNMECELWTRTWWFTWRRLGQGLSDRDGYFRFGLDLRAARRWSNRALRFQIMQRSHIYYKDGSPHPKFDLFHEIRIPKKDMIGMEYSLHTIQLFYWEYRNDALVPRVVIKDHDKDAPQYYARGRQEAFIQQVIPIELTKIKHIEQLEFAPETITMESLQNDYPENITRCIERKLPGYTRSDEWMGKRMMNGMNRAYFEPDADEENAYWVKYYGLCRYPHNNEYALPTARMKFKLREDGLPMPVQLNLTGPINSINRDPWQEHVYTKHDGEDWQHAKRVFRVNGSFTTELDEHFTGTHLNTEQFAIAAYRNLRLNPLSTLLLPHLKEVVLINHSADNLLLSEFIPNVTALTPRGVQIRTRDVLGMQDWKNWQPMEPLNEMHTCARAELLFWDILSKFVSDFIDDNLEEIKQHWFEVFCFSEDLVNHSVPVFLSDLDMSSLNKEDRELAEDRFQYYASQYCFDKEAQRETRDGELKAISPITLSPDFDESNAEQELQNLKHACTYMIMVATYLHTWINEHQYEQLGEVLYSCGGLRYGDKERGIIAPESDLSISPPLFRATQGLWFGNILSRTEYGFITTNNENDVNPKLIEMLLAKEKEFKDLEVDIHAIESRTNI